MGKDKVSKGGVVRNPKFHTEAIESVIDVAKNFKWNIKNLDLNLVEVHYSGFFID